MKPTAHIENWRKTGNHLVGTVSKHPRQEDFHKELQITSPLVVFDPEHNKAETLNTHYTLGAKAS